MCIYSVTLFTFILPLKDVLYYVARGVERRQTKETFLACFILGVQLSPADLLVGLFSGAEGNEQENGHVSLHVR